MSSVYGKTHRNLQDQFDSRKLADRLNDSIVKKEFDADAKNLSRPEICFFYRQLIIITCLRFHIKVETLVL